MVVRPPKPIPVEVWTIDGKKTTVMRDEIVLAKTLRLQFRLPGEVAARYRAPVELVSKDWVMR
jgi:hypothetical protein